MNGEIKQLSNIVISARKALFENSEIEYPPNKYTLSIKFIFSKRGFFSRNTEVDSVQKWFETCKRLGLHDIKFVIPTVYTNRYTLGFSNTSQGAIICFWKDDKASCFLPIWKYDNEQKGWIVEYKEHMDIYIQKSSLSYTDYTNDFLKILKDIAKFSADIGFPEFSDRFLKVYEVLCNNFSFEQHDILAHLPNGFKGIYYAVDTSDVFGAMGSWNDSPQVVAREMGLEKEYHELSERLLYQVRYHLMYVSNECWKRN